MQDRAETNTFAEDLGREYRKKFRNDDTHILLDAQGNFDSMQPGVDSALKAMIAEICAIRPRLVLFAGRSPALRTFLRELAARSCTDAPVTVFSGDSARNLTIRLRAGAHRLWVDDGANLDILYTALASPQTWQGRRDWVSRAAVVRFGKCTNCYHALFSEPLDDGNAIMSYDAVLTAVTAARNVATPQEPQPIAGALKNGLYQINSVKAVPGASGWIYFRNETGSSDRVPYNKAVPIMQLFADGTAVELTLSSRWGTPPTRPEPPR